MVAGWKEGEFLTNHLGRKFYSSDIWIYSASCYVVTVKDGVADSGDLDAGIRDAHARSGYWGDFYEGVSFNEKLNGFQIHVGS